MCTIRLLNRASSAIRAASSRVRIPSSQAGLLAEPPEVHAPWRAGATRLIRIEGRNMEGQSRGTFERV